MWWHGINSAFIFPAASLVLFGRQLGRGLTCHRGPSKSVRSFSSVYFFIWWSQSVAPSLSLFGSYVFGLYGMKEITRYSLKTHNSPYLKCWTKSNFIRTGG
jgi:hypothetical protein